MQTLHLTVQEQALFDALSDALQEGWLTRPETLTFEDSPQKKLTRLSLVRLHDPKLLALRERAMQISSIEEMTALLQNADLADVEDDDVAALFFAMGPTVLSGLIELQLRTAQTDTDIEGVAALTTIRNAMLVSYHPPS
jgi:hypothetical protein